MARQQTRPSKAPAPAPADTSSFHRSSAVARMLRMPVATLRVWERRYGLTQAALSPSGQRLYSARDVQRLVLVKQLTDLGHAIGSLAPLDLQQLQGVAATHAQALADTRVAEPRSLPQSTWRVAVIGAALGRRLASPQLLRQVGRPIDLLGPFDDALQAAAALTEAGAIDLLLVHAPRLHEGWAADLEGAAPALARVPRAVLYGFAAEAVCGALASAGMALLRGPQPDAVLAQWLRGLAAGGALQQQQQGLPDAELGASVPPRRWDDAALADFAGLSSTVACECPRHVAELLVQLSHFEAYSADCENRSPADAQLHAYLRQVAAASRARFEAALEHVAVHEGLLLPQPHRPGA